MYKVHIEARLTKNNPATPHYEYLPLDDNTSASVKKAVSAFKDKHPIYKFIRTLIVVKDELVLTDSFDTDIEIITEDS